MAKKKRRAGRPHCAYCGTRRGPFHLDHVVPASRGGPNEGNLVDACSACNLAKADRLPSEWLGKRVPLAIQHIERAVRELLGDLPPRIDRRGYRPTLEMELLDAEGDRRPEEEPEPDLETLEHIHTAESDELWAHADEAYDAYNDGVH